MDYQSGKIYKICSHQTKSVYVGSTIKTLNERFRVHKSYYKMFIMNDNDERAYITSMEILKYDDAYIELIENYPCNNKEELTKREGYYIRQYKENCVNIVLPGRTHEEFIEKKKADDKKYREQHKEKIKEYLKQYNKDNNVILLQKKKIYREANKDKRKESRKKTYTCECGSIISVAEKTRHNRSKKHLHYTANKVPDLA